WNERMRAPHAELLDWHRRLIALRRRTPALVDGKMERVHVSFDEDGRWLVVTRGTITIAANLGDTARDVPIDDAGSDRVVLLASSDDVARCAATVRLPPDG